MMKTTPAKPWLVMVMSAVTYLIGRRLLLPGIELRSHGSRSSWLLASLGEWWRPELSLLGLGVLWLVVVRLGLELVVGRARDDDRPKWSRLAFVAYLIATAVAASVICQQIVNADGDTLFLTEVSLQFTVMTIVSLVSGGVVIWALADWLTRAGVGHGALVLLAVEGLFSGVGFLWNLGRVSTGLLLGLVPALTVGVLMAVPLVVACLVMWRWPPRSWPVSWRGGMRLLSPLDYVMLPIAPVFVLWQLVPGDTHLYVLVSLAALTASWKVLCLPIVATALAVLLAVWWRRRADAGEPGHRAWQVAAISCVPIAVGLVTGGWVKSRDELEQEVQRELEQAASEPHSPFHGTGDHIVELGSEDGGPADVEILRQRLEAMGVSATPLESSPNRVVFRLGRADMVQDLMRSALARSLTLHDVRDDQRPVTARDGEADLGDGIRITKARPGGAGRALESEDLAALRSLLGSRPLPDGTMVAFEHEWRSTEGGWRLVFRPLLVEAEPSMSLDDVTDARVAYDERDGTPLVAITFGPRGTGELARLTTARVGKRLALARGDEVIMAPTIEEPVAEGHLRISMGFAASHATMLRQAREIVATVRSGVLVGRWRIVEIRPL